MRSSPALRAARAIRVAATGTIPVAPAPSASLLRFLRFQAAGEQEDVFFSPNLHCGAPFTPNLRPRRGYSTSKNSSSGVVDARGEDAVSIPQQQKKEQQRDILGSLKRSVQDTLREALPSRTAWVSRTPMHDVVPANAVIATLEAGFGFGNGRPIVSTATALARQAKAATNSLFITAQSRRDLSRQHDPTAALRRYASGDARPWMQRLAEMTGPHGAKELAKLSDLRPEDLPGSYAAHDPMGTIFGRSKAAAELKLRCTEFDEYGKVVLVNGEFKKSELIAKYGLQPRDLRKIDSSTLPSILVRPSSILVNLLHLRVLIQRDRVLIFDAWGSSNTYAQSMFMYDLEGKLGSKDGSAGQLPYEFRALEAVLVSVTSGLEGEFEGIREPVARVLRELEEDIDREKLRHLLVYSKKLGTFEQKARLVRDAVEALLEEDEDLSAMYLTEKAHDIRREIEDHTEIEMLLESYHKVADEIVQGSGNLVTNIRNTEEIIRAILDANRNALMLLDLKFSIGTLGIGSGAFVAALYGMNLKNYMEEAAWGFAGITGLGIGLVAIVCMYGMHKLRGVQLLRMWGERGSGNRGSWRDLDSTAGLPGEPRAERMRRLKEERMAVWQNRRELAEQARCEQKALRG